MTIDNDTAFVLLSMNKTVNKHGFDVVIVVDEEKHNKIYFHYDLCRREDFFPWLKERKNKV